LSVIPARERIYDALRNGKIDGWARPNGSGDIRKIEPIQWAGLRLRSWDGHDIAVPVDSEKNFVVLPNPLAEYVAGTVSENTPPTVWPDPVFLVRQIMNLWPKMGSGSDRSPDYGGASRTTPPRRAEDHNTALRRAAVMDVLAKFGVPGRDLEWGVFCTQVYKLCNTEYPERKFTETTRGFGAKSLQREVRYIRRNRGS
jgi:hypothetical protein